MAEPLCEREQESVTSCSSASVSCTASAGNTSSHLGQSTLLQQNLAKEVGQQDRYHYKQDGAFCFACHQFHRPGGNRGEKTGSNKDGFWKWKKGTSSFKTRNAATEHKYAMTAWNKWTNHRVRLNNMQSSDCRSCEKSQRKCMYESGCGVIEFHSTPGTRSERRH